MMDPDSDKFPLHTAAREGRGQSLTHQYHAELSTNSIAVTVAEALLKVYHFSTHSQN